eukprot:TRINITY_DN17648_c0_g1_i1.p1 TRINITY_DN17648_c0_g1~~TRINITY_DN17648_c0_g1_i1.p1  ORF type:complete len:459 (+),score=139.25 TRINITY_DN17648_c0_g1_i1:107-1483(+)
MPRGMSNWGTYRVGRTVRVPDWQRDMEVKCGGGCWKVLAAIALVGMPVMAFLAEQNLTAHRDAFQEVKGSEVTVMPDAGRQELQAVDGRLVHVPGSGWSGSVGDPDFSFTAPGLELSRHTEYCQWMETSTTRCERCPDGRDREGKQKYKDCNCVRQYHYHLGWRSHRINSLLFDQPANHHNPQRDPFPSRALLSKDAKLIPSGLDITPILGEGRLLAPSRPLAFAPGAARPPYGFFERLWSKMTGWQDPTLYGDIAELRNLPYSPAGREQFHYVGNGGYFFSPYTPSMWASGLRMAGQLLEGSLFDWQIGDLVPSCHAGDIRTHYTIKDPEVVSAAGKLQGGAFVPLPTSSAYHIGMVHAGAHSFAAMAAADLWEQKKWAILWRALSLVWGWMLAAVAERHGSCSFNAVGVLGLAGLMVSTAQFAAGGATWMSALVALGGVVLVAVTANTKPEHAKSQ